MTSIHAVWEQLRRQPLLAATAITLVASSLLSAGAGLWAYEAQHATSRQNDRLAEIVVDLQEQRDVDRARQCVTSWEGRRGIRSLMEALITAFAGAPPARVGAFRDDINHRLPDPTCDLDAALEVVAEADATPDPPPRRPIKETP